MSFLGKRNAQCIGTKGKICLVHSNNKKKEQSDWHGRERKRDYGRDGGTKDEY